MLEKKEIIPHYAIHIHFLPTANSSHLGTSFPELKLVSFSIQEIIQYLGLPCWLSGKEFAYNAEAMSLIPGLGRSLGEENSNPLQYSCLGNPMGRGAWWATVHKVTKELDTLSS